MIIQPGQLIATNKLIKQLKLIKNTLVLVGLSYQFALLISTKKTPYNQLQIGLFQAGIYA